MKNILRINSENVLLVNMTPVENEKAVMLQLREIGGKMVDLSFSSDIVNIKKWKYVMLLEKQLKVNKLL